MAGVDDSIGEQPLERFPRARCVSDDRPGRTRLSSRTSS